MEMDDIVRTMEKAREFVQCDFALGAEGDELTISWPRKQALAKWQRYYQSTINRPG